MRGGERAAESQARDRASPRAICGPGTGVRNPAQHRMASEPKQPRQFRAERHRHRRRATSRKGIPPSPGPPAACHRRSFTSRARRCQGRLVDRRRLGALAGIVGPPLFVAVFVVEGWLRPGYDSRSMYLSELALGPRGIIQITNLVVYGILLLVFARGIAAQFPHGNAARWGPRLLRIAGLGWIGAGLFVMDPQALSEPLAQFSWHCWLHALFGWLLMVGMPGSCFVFLR